MGLVVRDVVNKLLEPVERLEQTVDRLRFGCMQTRVTGIATAFMPTQRVLEVAVASRANLIIAHEDPFYSHHDTFERELEHDPVYRAKKQFIMDSGLAIYRFHDVVHRYRPDGIAEGLLDALGWSGLVTRHDPAASFVRIPPKTVKDIAGLIKRKLDIPYVRISGNPDMECRRIGMFVGYRGGGRLVIPLIEQEKLDLVIYGEGPEWETPEYVRDAAHQGRTKAIIVLGHAESEEAGMRLLAGRLQRQFPDVPVKFLSDRPLFQII